MTTPRTHPRIRLRGVAAMAGAAALVGALTLPGPATASDVGTLQDTEVTIDAFAFMPPDIQVTVGETVTWNNVQAGVPHTVTADNGEFDTGVLDSGTSASVTFTEASNGPIPYHCEIHTSMTGTVTVNAP